MEKNIVHEKSLSLNYKILKKFLLSAQPKVISVISDNNLLIKTIEKVSGELTISAIYISPQLDKELIKRIESYVNSELRFYVKGKIVKVNQLDIGGDNNSNRDLLFFLSSGSTGTPKIIAKKRKKVIQEAKELHKIIPHSNNIISNVSPNHYYGFIYLVIFPIYLETKLKAFSPLVPIQHIIKNSNKDVLIITTPVHEKLVAKYLNKDKDNVYNILTAGASVDKNTIKSLVSKGVHVFDQFGTTEYGALFITEYAKNRSKLHFLYGVKLKLFKDCTKVKSPFAAKYYVNKKNRHKRIGFSLHDIFEKKGSELVYIGRNDNIININGIKINPEVYESIINGINGVLQSFVFKENGSLSVKIYPDEKNFQEMHLIKIIRDTLENNTKLNHSYLPTKYYISKESLTTNGKFKRRNI